MQPGGLLYPIGMIVMTKRLNKLAINNIIIMGKLGGGKSNQAFTLTRSLFLRINIHNNYSRLKNQNILTFVVQFFGYTTCQNIGWVACSFRKSFLHQVSRYTKNYVKCL